MSLRDYINSDGTGFQFPLLELGNGGFIDFNDFKIRIGQNAGKFGMESFAVAIGNRAGEENLSGSAIAIGADAGRFDADATSISIGQESGQDGKGLNSVSMGLRSAQLDQGIDAVAIGRDAGNGFQSQDAVSIGREAGFSSQGQDAVSIGREAGKTIQGENSVAVGVQSGQNNQGGFATALGRLAGQTSQGINTVAVGNAAGQTIQGENSVAVGVSSGQTNQGGFATALGRLAGQTSQGINAVAVGNSTGQTSQGINSVAVGVLAGAVSSGASSVALGDRAGRFNAGTNVVAIGRAAAEGSLLNTLAGAGNSSIAIGDFAGSLGLRSDAIAIGRTAGFGTVDSTGNPINRLGQQSIAIGLNASKNAINIANTIAIGTNSADGIIYDTLNGQQTDSITIGTNSGRFGLRSNTVAIGRDAGQGATNVWTTQTTPTSSPSIDWFDITNGTPIPGGRLVVVGQDNTDRVMYSDNGVLWQNATPAPPANNWRGVVWSQTLGLYSAVSSTGSPRAMFSNDGIIWSQVGISGDPAFNTVGWGGITLGFPSGLDRFVAVGNNAVMYSDDGLTWNVSILTSPLNKNWLNVVWSQELGLYVAIAFGGTSMYSSDGITWSNVGVSGLIANNWRSITWGAGVGSGVGRFVCVSENAVSGGTLNRVAYSDDGINWNMANATQANIWRSVVYAPAPISLFCAVSRTGTNRTMTSADGILWTARVASTNNEHRAITYSSNLGLFVSVAGTGSGDQVMTSNISLINRLGQESIAMGYRAGRYGINSVNTIAIGREAGEGAIGNSTGGQGANAIAIGLQAGRTTQGVRAVAIGTNAGSISQSTDAIAIGESAGYNSQGANSIAIGKKAGDASQAANSIVINATGGILNNTTADSCKIAPIRQNNPQTEILHYNNTTKEITRSNGDIFWPSTLDFSDMFSDITYPVVMGTGIADRKYIRIGRYIKGYFKYSYGTAGVASFGSDPAILLPSFVDITAGDVIVGHFIYNSSGFASPYTGVMVVNATAKNVAIFKLFRDDASPPPFSRLQNISATTPDPSIQTDGVVEITFDYISAN